MSQKESNGAVRIDMLHGGIFRKMLLFALPLIASGILQQSFNSVDIAVVWQFASSQALAAVGSNGLIISLIINLFIGISVGANVVIAHYIGQKDEKGIRNAISTTAVIAVASGIFLLAVGMLIAKPILEALDTPEDVIDLAVLYLRIFSIGMPFMMIYNFGSAILRSTGDTKRPFYSLVIAGFVNVGLNLLLVIVFDMSVAGVAIATVISNLVNAAIIVYFLTHEQGIFRLNLRKLSVSRTELRKILKIGVPAGLQGMVFSISNVFVLATINSFGSAAVAGSSSALNYEYYCYFVISAFAQAAVAFTSQNYGAGQIERCKSIFRQSMLLSIAGCAFFNVLIVWQKDFFIGFFTSEPEIIRYAALRMEYVLLFQFIASSYEISGAALRGIGYSMTPTVLTIFGTCLLRLVWIFAVVPLSRSYETLLSVYPISWVITGVAVCTAYAIIRRKAFALQSASR
ncbi:MAG: MATE family efflux transporter [Odoribacter sp.]|nr:MATE family efflux transporter [Odoribacter sp.]